MVSIEEINVNEGLIGTDPTPTEIINDDTRSNIKFDFMTETGEGQIEDYKEHVLNFNKSTWLARILRGMTGLFGSLNYALLDIAVGIIEGINESKKGGGLFGSKKVD